MRPISEATTTNMNVLKDCTKAVIDAFSYAIKENELFSFTGDQSSTIRKLVSTYRGTPFERSVKGLLVTTFSIDNSRYSMSRRLHHKSTGETIKVPNTVMGFLRIDRGSPPHLVIHLSSFMGSHETHTKQEMLAFRNPDLPIKSLEGIIAHELRHLFQSVLYTNYFNRDRELPYHKDPIELDAAFMHHLYEYSPGDYDNVSKYIDDVMKSFSEYKKISPSDKLWRHYRRKAAQYYLNAQTSQSQKDLTQSLDDRRQTARAKLLDPIKKAISQYSDRSFDLRVLPGYHQNSSNFLLPERVFRFVYNFLSNPTRTLPGNFPFIFLVCALFVKDDAARQLRILLERILGTTLEAATDYSQFEDFDQSAITNYVRMKFQ